MYIHGLVLFANNKSLIHRAYSHDTHLSYLIQVFRCPLFFAYSLVASYLTYLFFRLFATLLIATCFFSVHLISIVSSSQLLTYSTKLLSSYGTSSDLDKLTSVRKIQSLTL